jgi:hypothetical protein
VPRVDSHAHVLPDAYLAGLRLPDGSPFPIPPAPLEALRGAMERFGIDAAVISTGPPGAFLGDQALRRRRRRLFDHTPRSGRAARTDR